MRLTGKKYLCLLMFSVVFCWFFSLMVAVISWQSQNATELLLKGIVVGIGGWCGWGLLKQRRQVILFALGLCFYALFGSLVWLYYSTLLPLIYGQELQPGVYDFLAVLYIIGGSIVIWFLLRRDTRQFFKSGR